MTAKRNELALRSQPELHYVVILSMDRRMTSSGIRLNDCLFTEPVSLVGWTPPHFAGIAAILVRDPNWAPKPFQPLSFAEFGNNAPMYAWLTNYGTLLSAAQGRELLVAVCPLPFLTTAQRRAVREDLVWAYNPPCQPAADRVTLSIQDAPALAPPQTSIKTPRRRFGFIPEDEEAA
jgi:hypothetical protein